MEEEHINTQELPMKWKTEFILVVESNTHHGNIRVEKALLEIVVPGHINLADDYVYFTDAGGYEIHHIQSTLDIANRMTTHAYRVDIDSDSDDAENRFIQVVDHVVAVGWKLVSRISRRTRRKHDTR